MGLRCIFSNVLVLLLVAQTGVARRTKPKPGQQQHPHHQRHAAGSLVADELDRSMLAADPAAMAQREPAATQVPAADSLASGGAPPPDMVQPPPPWSSAPPAGQLSPVLSPPAHAAPAALTQPPPVTAAVPYNTQYALPQTSSQFLSDLLAVQLARSQQQRFSDADVDLMLRAMQVNTELMGANTRNSGRSSLAHAIGCGGCLLKAQGTAMAIALGLMHTVYYMPWRVPDAPTTLCAQRRWIADNLTPEFEEFLWRFEVMFAHGPDPLANATWVLGLEQNAFSDLDRQLILMALCDELDEHHASEGWWSKNWKMRSLEFQDVLVELARQLAPGWLEDTMRFWLGVTRSMFKLGDLQHHAHPESEVSKMVNQMVSLKLVTLQHKLTPMIHDPVIKTSLQWQLDGRLTPAEILAGWDEHYESMAGICCSQGGPCPDGAAQQAA